MDPEKARRFAILKALKAHHEATAKKLGAQINELGAELYDDFANDGIESYQLAAVVNGRVLFADRRNRTLRPEAKLKPSVTTVNVERFHAWMRANGFGDLIKESIHPGTLESWVNKRTDENLPLPPKELMSVFTVETVKVTSARAPSSQGGKA